MVRRRFSVARTMRPAGASSWDGFALLDELYATPASGASRRSCCRRDRAGRRDRVCPRAFANARRIFAGRAAIGEAGRVPGIGLLGRIGRKADGAAIGVCRRLAVDRLRHREHAGLGEVENAVAVDLGRPDTRACRAARHRTPWPFRGRWCRSSHAKTFFNSSPFFRTNSRIAVALRKEQPRRCPLPGNVDGAVGVVQAGDGQTGRGRGSCARSRRITVR